MHTALSPASLPAMRRALDLAVLSPIQRALLATDGTLTDMIEALFLEPIALVKRAERNAEGIAVHPALGVSESEPRLLRQVLLRGARSGTNYVYAESVIATDRLPSAVRAALASDVPLGRLFVAFRLETFKELIDVGEYEQEAAFEFGWPCRRCFGRTYRVTSGGQPVMLISEYFPATLLRQAIDHADRRTHRSCVR
jgi:chorismate-pyruvate lyase